MKTGAVYFVCFFLFLLTAGCMHGAKSRGEAERFVALPVSDSAVQTGTDPFVYLKPAGEVEEYRKRMALQRFTGVPVTHPDAYKIETQQPVYAPRVTRVVLDVINLDAPAAEPEYHRLERWNGDGWVPFPFRDNLAFAGVGRVLARGDTLPETIFASEFKNPLDSGKYKVHFYVALNLYTGFTLTEDSIRPLPVNPPADSAFGFRVLESPADSIRVLFENRTNLPVLPNFFPSVENPETGYSAHPLARSGWIGEHTWMEKRGLLQGGEAFVAGIPVAWDVNRLTDPNEKKQFASGRLAPGTYRLGLLLSVFMETEFEVR